MPARIRRRLRRIIVGYLFLAWSVAWAAIDYVAPDLLALPWAQAMVGVGVAWVGGFAASLSRMVAAAYEARPFRHGHEFAKDSAVSAVIGLSGYWAGMSQSMSPALLALTLLLGGYAGTRTLATWVDRVIKPRD